MKVHELLAIIGDSGHPLSAEVGVAVVGAKALAEISAAADHGSGYVPEQAHPVKDVVWARIGPAPGTFEAMILVAEAQMETTSEPAE
jgi:hypothetical protein